MSALVLSLASKLDPVSMFQVLHDMGHVPLGEVFSPYNLKYDAKVFDFLFTLAVYLTSIMKAIFFLSNVTKGLPWRGFPYLYPYSEKSSCRIHNSPAATPLVTNSLSYRQS